jgi:hypothetical protein
VPRLFLKRRFSDAVAQPWEICVFRFPTCA